jgi:hypothetical protein
MGTGLFGLLFLLVLLCSFLPAFVGKWREYTGYVEHNKDARHTGSVCPHLRRAPFTSTTLSLSYYYIYKYNKRGRV